MKDRILCVIDFSESSAQALKWAQKFAEKTGATLTVLYSYRLLNSGNLSDIVSFKKQTEENSRKKFVELAGSDSKALFVTEIGFYSDNIENFIRKNPLTLVVMSDAMAHLIYDHKGQTLQQFQRAIKVPLMVVSRENEMPALLSIEKDFPLGKIAS